VTVRLKKLFDGRSLTLRQDYIYGFDVRKAAGFMGLVNIRGRLISKGSVVNV